MPKETSRWAAVVARLTDLTQEGTIRWEVDNFTSADSVVFRTDYKERRLRLQKRTVPNMETSPMESEDRYSLEFVDRNNNPVWQFPETASLAHLYRAVQYQAADVKGFLDDLFSEE